MENPRGTVEYEMANSQSFHFHFSNGFSATFPPLFNRLFHGESGKTQGAKAEEAVLRREDTPGRVTFSSAGCESCERMDASQKECGPSKRALRTRHRLCLMVTPI